MINLETVLNQETKLFEVYQNVKYYHHGGPPDYFLELTAKSEEWWSVSKDSACLFEVYKIYRDGKTRKILRRAIILETIIIVLTVYHSQQPVDQSSSRTLKKLGKMLHAAH